MTLSAAPLPASSFEHKLRAAWGGMLKGLARHQSVRGSGNGLHYQTISLAEASADGMLFLQPVSDASGEVTGFRVRHGNGAAARLLPARTEPLAGYRLEQVLPCLAGADALRQYRDILRTGEPRTSEMAVGDADVSATWLRVSAARLEQGLLLTLHDLTGARARERELCHQVQRDELTGLPNRTLLDDRLQEALKRARRNKQAAAVLLLDLDGLEKINESHGRPAGDQVLRAVSKRLSDAVRSTDSVMRLGGDNFVIVLNDVSTQGPVTDFARKIVLSMFAPIPWHGRELHVTASIGVAMYPAAGTTPETLLVQADIEMNRMKRAHCAAGMGMRLPTLMDSRTFAVSLS